MTHHRSPDSAKVLRLPVAILALLASQLLISLPAKAEEPVEAILQGLRDRGYNDMALYYLERLGNNSSTPASLEERLEYEEALILVSTFRQEPEPEVRERLLNQAVAKLAEFIEGHPNHPLAIEASTTLGNLYVDQALSLVRQAKADDAEDPESLHEEARTLFDKALQTYLDRKEDVRAQLIEIGSDEPDSQEALEHRDGLRAQYIQVQLIAANIKYEKSKTYEEGSDAWRTALTESGEEFENIFERYNSRMAGLYALMYQGQCLQDLGEIEDALVQYEELLRLEAPSPAQRALKMKALRRAMECWIMEESNQVEHAITLGQAALRDATEAEQNHPDGLALRYTLALAHKAKGEALPENSGDQTRAYENSRSLAQGVARVPCEYRVPAQELLAELSGLAGDRDDNDADPTTFAEALEAGREALNQFQQATQGAQLIRDRMQHVTDSAERAGMESQVTTFLTQQETERTRALNMFRLAVDLSNSETSLDDINLVRYYLCYTLYRQAADVEGQSDLYYDSAVIGEFLATHYPGARGAQQCASYAVAAFQAIYRNAPEEDRAHELGSMIRMADYIAQTWPDGAAGADALLNLVKFMIIGRKPLQADDYLRQMGPDLAQRHEAELLVGNSLWRLYKSQLRISRQSEEQREPGVEVPTEQELSQLRERAGEVLAAAVASFGRRELQPPQVDAIVGLAEYHVDSGTPAEAIPLLEANERGLLPLIAASHPATQRNNFNINVYHIAMRAYLGNLANENNARHVEKVASLANQLGESLSSSEQGRQRMLHIFLRLSQSILTDLESIDQLDHQTTLSSALDVLLQKVLTSTNEANYRQWVAQNYFSMAEALHQEGTDLSDTALGYFNQSAVIFEALIPATSGDRRRQLEAKLARMHRRTGNFERAMEGYLRLLEENQQLLNLQVEAAMCLQEWGDADRAIYSEAIHGRAPDEEGENIIWGWHQLSQRLNDAGDNYRTNYYSARYSVVTCLYKTAESATDQDERQEYLRRAARGVTVLYEYNLKPTLESEEASEELKEAARTWLPRFNELHRTIQRGQGVDLTNLGDS